MSGWAALAEGLGKAIDTGVNIWKYTDDRDRTSRARRRVEKNKEDVDNQYATMLADLEEYYNNRGSLGSKEDVNTYKNIIANYNPEDYVYDDYGKFRDEYNKTVDDFVNPYYDQIIKSTTDSLQHTAAGAGLGRGTGAALNIAQGVAEKEDELYNTALNQYNSDREQAYTEYSDYIKNKQAQLDALNKAKAYQMDMYGNLANDYYDAMDAEQTAKMNLRSDKIASDQGYAATLASLI